MIRFGKSFGPLLEIKSDLFDNNDDSVGRQKQIDDIYARQPLRRHCKNCDGPLGGTDFEIGSVGYVWCCRCGHLNGRHEDSEDFASAVYTENAGAAYARNYLSKDRQAYDRRVSDIYLPKATFLADALREQGRDLAALSCLDLGAGSGYFVAALRSAGASRIKGYDVSGTQVEFANAMLGEPLLIHHRPEELSAIVHDTDANVVSMIGVLEHLRDPRSILAAFRQNRTISYLFISLPLVGPSVIFEAIFSGVMKRHLTGGHTHLFTESSIDWMCREFGFDRCAEWWFGSDMLDLYRSVLVNLRQEPNRTKLAKTWRDHMLPALDAMQFALDERKLSSEVHLLLKVKR